MTKTFVEIFYPGSMFAETSVKEVQDRKPIDLPSNAYAYRFFDKQVIESNGETLEGKPKNYSGFYYKGVVYSLEEVKSKFPENRILISNMESNKNSLVVKTHLGNWQPFTDKDTII